MAQGQEVREWREELTNSPTQNVNIIQNWIAFGSVATSHPPPQDVHLRPEPALVYGRKKTVAPRAGRHPPTVCDLRCIPGPPPTAVAS